MTNSELEDHLPLSHFSFQILVALGEGPGHGYAIGKEVEERTLGKLRPTTGALYQALRRLTDSGLIEPAPAENAKASDSRRQFFRLTRQGRRVAALETKRLSDLVAVAKSRDLFPKAERS